MSVMDKLINAMKFNDDEDFDEDEEYEEGLPRHQHLSMI